MAVDTPPWRAWQAEARRAGKRGYPVADCGQGRQGWMMPSLWPPDSRPEALPP